MLFKTEVHGVSQLKQNKVKVRLVEGVIMVTLPIQVNLMTHKSNNLSILDVSLLSTKRENSNSGGLAKHATSANSLIILA